MSNCSSRSRVNSPSLRLIEFSARCSGSICHHRSVQGRYLSRKSQRVVVASWRTVASVTSCGGWDSTEQALSIFVAIALIAGCSGGDSKTSNGVPRIRRPANQHPPTPRPPLSHTSDAPTTTAASLPPVDVPQPPPPAAITGTTPQEQALSLSTSVSTATDPIGGWLAAYDSMGIPVLGAGGAGIGTTGDDPDRSDVRRGVDAIRRRARRPAVCR